MKKGITISILAITIVIMFIIVGTTSAIGINSIKTAEYEEYTSKLLRVSDYVNEYYLKNGTLPIKHEIISKEGLPESLRSVIISNNDTNNNLYVVDMEKINVESVNLGRGSIQNLDVFVVAENTHNLYYLKGIRYKGNTYYSLDV